MYTLFEPARLGSLTLKNRTMRSATNEHLSEADGRLSRAWADILIELAKNEVGLTISGDLAVDGRYRAGLGQAVLEEGSDTTFMIAAAEGTHRYGGKLIIQLSHCGLKSGIQTNGRPPKGPADFTLAELDDLVDRFTAAARLCQNSGTDGVQIHCAHGYLLSSFLNPTQNSRMDEYGGSLENRFRLIRRILKAVREVCGSAFALLVKVDSDGCGDLHRLLELLQEVGVDGVEVSGLNFASRRVEKVPFFLNDLLAAREGIDIPLILVGGIFSRQAAQAALDAGIPFVSFARSLICQPDFIARLKSGALEESPCLACNGCFQVHRRRPVRCVQHREPISHFEKLFGPYSE